MFVPLQRAFLAALMALIPVKESFYTACSGGYVAHFTAKIMFTVFIASHRHIFNCSSKYDSFHIFRFMSFPPTGILRTRMASSPVFLISSMDREVRPVMIAMF